MKKFLLAILITFLISVAIGVISIVTHKHFNPIFDNIKKPVIYLYPEETTSVNIALDIDGDITCTYPKYKKSWNVVANSDGSLLYDGKEYNYLYWEGSINLGNDFKQGFCVKGDDVASFLEEKLELLGLNRKEANEFIVYWLPLMEKNDYNIISFRFDEYTNAARIITNPQVDTSIRVFMSWKASDKYIDIEPQIFDETPIRQGFTLVEWGGEEIK